MKTTEKSPEYRGKTAFLGKVGKILYTIKHLFHFL